MEKECKESSYMVKMHVPNRQNISFFTAKKLSAERLTENRLR